MEMRSSRRECIASLRTAAASFTLPGRLSASQAKHPGIRFGYTAMTWGKAERQAIDDISAVGFEGIQFRNDALKEFQPAELRELLQQHKLTFVALSSGDVSIEPALERDQTAEHTAHAKFVHDAGGLYLQILDQLKPYPRNVTPEECKRLGRILTELGKRTADLGVPLGYHNHLNTLSEKPGNLDVVLESSDPKYVKLELDTAHSVAGGGDPVSEIEKYHDRLLYLHLKDVVDIPMSTEGAKYPFKFVELGRGKVNLPAVFSALDKIKYRGWAVVELDRVPDQARTPKGSALVSKRYLEEAIGVTV